MADSWKIDGNCKECRRKNYCQKPCTLNKRLREMILHNTVKKALDDKFGFSKIMEKLSEGR